MSATKFTVGQELSSPSICDSNCIFTGKVLKRTAKTVTIETRMEGVRRLKIHVNDEGIEFIFPFGRYSMAPTFKANR